MGSAKPLSMIARVWLILYNSINVIGWSSIGYKMALFYKEEQTNVGLYNEIQSFLLLFQTSAVLEILHTIIKIVPSNPFMTTMQVFSRVGLVYSVLEPVSAARDCIGVAMLLFAWTITEIVRYSFYLFTLLGGVPYILKWLRYTLFIILYPIGVVGEVLTVYASLKPVKDQEIYTIRLPNSFNIVLDYHLVLMCLFPLYVFYFPKLYFYMFSQRKKALSPIKKD